MKRLSFITLSTLLSLFTVACNQNKPLKSAQNNQPVYEGPTDTITPPPVLPANIRSSGISAAALNNLQKVFSDALPVRPVMSSQSGISNASNISAQGPRDKIYASHTITFVDFYGAPFAYVTSSSRRLIGFLSPLTISTHHNPTAIPPTDSSTWEDATYVTGTNTRRTPISTSYYQYPILYGIYSRESSLKGVKDYYIKRYVAPSDAQFWAELTDGRYFDLIKREFVSSDDVTKAKQSYDEVLAKAALDGSFPSYADAAWTEMSAAFTSGDSPLIDTRSCDTSTSALCTSLAAKSMIKSQSLTWGGTSCVRRWFLWFNWLSCDSNVWYGNMPNSKYAKDDYQETDPSGIAEGCGPASGAAMLWWWKNYKTYNTIDNDYHSDYWTYGIDAAFKRAKTKLITDMRAFKWGNQRAVWPGEYADGLNRYLDARGITNLRAKSLYGWGPFMWGQFLDRLKTQFSKEEPVAALYFFFDLQHYGVLKHFRRDPFGNIWAATQSGGYNMNLSAWWAVRGVYWVEQVP